MTESFKGLLQRNGSRRTSDKIVIEEDGGHKIVVLVVPDFSRSVGLCTSIDCLTMPSAVSGLNDFAGGG